MRFNSIDIFRALTMFFMVFVNDLWTLNGYPKWLGHFPTHEDGMGFSDVIFPFFLFIVGLSIPAAIKNRKQKGEGTPKIIQHIFLRSLALLTMGFFIVNYENIHKTDMIISPFLWEILMVTAFLLIWNNYKANTQLPKILKRILPLSGIALLIVLSFIYKDASYAGESIALKPHWWGILGIIGWSYLYAALAYLFSGNNSGKLAGVAILFLLLNVQEFAFPDWGLQGFTLFTSAAHYSLVWLGVIAGALLWDSHPHKKMNRLWVLGLLCLGIGFALRPLWGISKNLATPSWTLITAGLAFIGFYALYIITDKHKITSWATPISPAGRSTLTCYIIPYIWYGIVALFSIQILPDILLSGVLGIIKCLIFSAIVVLITFGLERVGVRMRI